MASSDPDPNSDFRSALRGGVAIPAMPLALTAARQLDERRQRALCRYYLAAGAGGIAAAVHTTQFAIRDPRIALFELVLTIVAEELARSAAKPVRIAGVCGPTPQAVKEATLIRNLNYHAALLSLAALKNASEDQVLTHCREISQILPIIGFYLQGAVGGRILPYSFWRRFAEIPNVLAIKIAPFNRYQTLDVVRAIAEAGRDGAAAGGIALYTGNDDNIVADLITPFRFKTSFGKTVERRIVGGLLGHWAVWTKKAVEILQTCQLASTGGSVPQELLRLNVEVTDANAAFFDAAHNFAGCIAGLHEVLRRQGLFEGIWCLDPHEALSPGQREEIDRVYTAYPHLNDDHFVAQHRDEWLRG